MPQLDTEELAEKEYESKQKIETRMDTYNKAVLKQKQGQRKLDQSYMMKG